MMNDWSEIYNLADGYRQQQQWQKAAIAFQTAIELRPDFFWSYHHLGDALTQLQQWNQASLAYSRAVKLDPSFFWSWHNLGDALTQLQQWNKASLAYSRAVELDPSFFWSWHNLGDALTQLRQWDRAIAAYLQAAQLQPDNQLIYQKIGTAFEERGGLEQSIADYRQIARAQERSSYWQRFLIEPQTLVNIADILATKHQVRAAIALYYLVLEIQPQNAAILAKLAKLLQQQNELAQTIAASEQNLSSQLLNRQGDQPTPQTQTQLVAEQTEIAINHPISPEQLESLCSAVGWSSRPLNKVKQALENSFCYVTAWQINREQKKLIGFTRAVADGAFHAVLLDIIVHPEFQNQGLGKKIVKAAIAQLNHSQIGDITLFASPHVANFYHKLGFVSQPNNLKWMLFSPNPSVKNKHKD